MMLQQQFALLSPLLAIFILLAVLILYVHYSTDKLYRIKLLMGPARLLACAGAFPFVGVKLGYGWPTALPQSFEYVAHKAIVVGHEKRWVDVLLVSRKPLKGEPRLHRIPWSPQIEDVLEKAQSMKEGKEGGDIVMNGTGAAPRFGDSYSDYVPERVLPRQQNPKDGEPSRRAPSPLLTKAGGLSV